jgi:hypothetical protein
MSGIMPRLLVHMLSRTVVINAIKVSLFVGTCLNAINQGAAIWRGDDVEWGKFLLNYAVPYLVASYSAAKARMALEG